jgi:hypothetical protein
MAEWLELEDLLKRPTAKYRLEREKVGSHWLMSAHNSNQAL